MGLIYLQAWIYLAEDQHYHCNMETMKDGFLATINRSYLQSPSGDKNRHENKLYNPFVFCVSDKLYMSIVHLLCL